MKFAEAIKHRKHLIGVGKHLGNSAWDMRRACGEKFFRAFDTAFGLQPITEFPYLLRYI